MKVVVVVVIVSEGLTVVVDVVTVLADPQALAEASDLGSPNADLALCQACRKGDIDKVKTQGWRDLWSRRCTVYTKFARSSL